MQQRDLTVRIGQLGTLQPMSGSMTSVQSILSSQYRARARQAREQAADTVNEEKRQGLLHDAARWEKMAEFVDKRGPVEINRLPAAANCPTSNI
jgi:hypothetical protein